MKRDEDEYINDEMVEEEDEEKELPNALWRNEKTDNEISKLTNYMVLFMCFIVPIPFGILAGVYLLGRNEKEIRELGAVNEWQPGWGHWTQARPVFRGAVISRFG